MCKQAYSIDPSRWLTNFVAGVALKALGRIEEACKYLHQAAVIAPEDSQTARLLMQTRIVVDGIESAVAEYRAHCVRLGREGRVVEAPIQSVCEWFIQRGLSIQKAGEAEEIPFEAPAVWGRAAESTCVTVTSNQPYVVEIPDAQIFSRSSLILTRDNCVLSDTAGHPELGQFVSLAYESVVVCQQPGRVALDFEDYQICKIPAGIWLSGLASNAFGHWLPEFLPKLQFLRQHPSFNSLPIIVDDEMPPSHMAHLRRLVDNPVIILPAKTSFVCERLLVAPSPTFFPVDLLQNNIPEYRIGALSPRALRFLRERVPVGPEKRGGRIFLGRKTMKWRRLLNEDEISRYLSSVGFETVYIEDMTAEQQIILFQGAEWIVAPNGSSILNLIFSNPAAKILILTQNNLFNWGNFQGPMSALGYSPVFVCGEESAAIDQKHADYQVPLKLVQQVLTAMDLKEAEV